MKRLLALFKNTVSTLWQVARRAGLRLLGAALFGCKCIDRASILIHRFMRGFEPWGILIAIVGLAAALIGLVVELEDRQSERIFRAWQIVLDAQEKPVAARGGSFREALEYLNRQFGGWFCDSDDSKTAWLSVQWYSEKLTGNSRRTCLIPTKRQESLAELQAPGADLIGVDLSGAVLREGVQEVHGLTQQQLDDACASKDPPINLPVSSLEELTWKHRPCPKPD